MLSPAVLRRFDAQLAVAVDEVISGRDHLGQGALSATLKNGRLTLEPVTVSLPGGTVELGFAYQPNETDVALDAWAKIEQLDYGLLAWRIDSDSEVGGVISVDIDLALRGQPGHLMAGGNGYIDFAVWPNDLNAGIFDLWAVNVVSALLPSIDDENQSRLNCIVGRFQLSDGVMRPTALLIDSTQIQASGDGEIDFNNGTIKFRAAPRSKRPQMFSAKTPVEVEGKFSDFGVEVPGGALAGTVLRMVSSPVTTPFKWVFSEKPAADGREACDYAWRVKEPPAADEQVQDETPPRIGPPRFP